MSIRDRVKKNPDFKKKAQPGWVLLVFFGCAVPAAVSKHGKGK